MSLVHHLSERCSALVGFQDIWLGLRIAFLCFAPLSYLAFKDTFESNQSPCEILCLGSFLVDTASLTDLVAFSRTISHEDIGELCTGCKPLLASGNGKMPMSKWEAKSTQNRSGY